MLPLSRENIPEKSPTSIHSASNRSGPCCPGLSHVGLLPLALVTDPVPGLLITHYGCGLGTLTLFVSTPDVQRAVLPSECVAQTPPQTGPADRCSGSLGGGAGACLLLPYSNQDKRVCICSVRHLSTVSHHLNWGVCVFYWLAVLVTGHLFICCVGVTVSWRPGLFIV